MSRDIANLKENLDKHLDASKEGIEGFSDLSNLVYEMVGKMHGIQGQLDRIEARLDRRVVK